MSISVVIPSIPTRTELLAEALRSAYNQTLPPTEVCIAVDTRREGAAITRHRALLMASCEWVAFLDDDDMFLPEHLETLWNGAQEHKAQYVYSYFRRDVGGDPLGYFGKGFDPTSPHQTTITTLVRRDIAVAAGFLNHFDMHPNWSGEDWRFTLRCLGLGAHIMHIPKETWIWRRHWGNSSGIVGRGDAK